jgi:hypothetical protein
MASDAPDFLINVRERVSSSILESTVIYHFPVESHVIEENYFFPSGAHLTLSCRPTADQPEMVPAVELVFDYTWDRCGA